MIDTNVTRALGWALLHFLWQGTAVAAAAWVLLRVFRSAGARYLVAIGAMATMPLCFAVTTAIGYRWASPFVHTPEGSLIWYPSNVPAATPDQSADRNLTPEKSRHIPSSATTRSAEPAIGSAPPDAQSRVSVTSLRDRVAESLPVLVIVWLSGVMFLSLRLLGGWSAARRLVYHGTRPASAQYQRIFQALVERLGVRQAVSLFESTVAAVPSVVGWVRPVILLPATALTGLSPTQIELILAHELAHVRRHDYLINLLQCAVEALLFYHPAIWWLSHRARDERELCCDDIAVAVTGDAREYAEALVALERMRVVPELAMAATGGALLPRIRRLVDPSTLAVEVFPRWIAGGLVVSLLGAGALGSGLPQLKPLAPRPGHSEEAKAQGPSDTTRKKQQKATRGFSEPAVAPDTVIAHPDPSRPLAERMDWAKSRGSSTRRPYYVVYSVRRVESVKGSIYIGNGIFIGSGNVMSGSIVSIGDASKFSTPGTRLMSLFSGEPSHIAIIQGFTGDKLDDAGAVSLVMPFDFHGRPVYWLGAAESAQSLDLLKQTMGQVNKTDLREMLVRLIGVHETSDAVVSFLAGVLQGNDSPEVRDDAAEWLGHHPTRRSLDVLDGAARRDRSRDVRKEAAEAVGDLPMPEAFDVLVKLARELDVAEVRQEAVEALGEREEADAPKVLGDIALKDRDREVQREAVETLGELSDARGLPTLKNLVLTHPAADVREEAVETWGESAPVDQAVDLMEEVIRNDPSRDVRREAIEDLIDLRDGKGLEIARKIAKDHDDPEVRREAVEDLPPHLPVDQAIAMLREVIANDPSYDVRNEAVETLGDLKDDRAVPVLADVARNGTSDDLMAEAVETLGEWKSAASLKAVADIAGSHPRSRVRAEAVETYGENASGEDALALFKKLVASERSEEVLSEIFETALELRGADGVPFVMDAVKNSRDTYVRDVAADELKDSDDQRAKALVRELKLDD